MSSVEQLKSNLTETNTSVVVHVDEILDPQRRRSVESVVEQVDGVMQAQFNEKRHHLMIVDYDPQQTNSGAILMRVKCQRLHAQLI